METNTKSLLTRELYLKCSRKQYVINIKDFFSSSMLHKYCIQGDCNNGLSTSRRLKDIRLFLLKVCYCLVLWSSKPSTLLNSAKLISYLTLARLGDSLLQMFPTLAKLNNAYIKTNQGTIKVFL